jgi:hypothetical protein
MKTVDFVNELVEKAAEALRTKKVSSLEMGYSKDANFSNKVISLPNFNPIYKQTIIEHNRICVHSMLGVFPYEILKSKAPNQTKDEWEYQLGLYESYTNSVWNRAKNKTKIISNKQNYSITGFDSEQKKYFYEDYPTYHSIESFFWDVVRDKKIDFPNQLLLIEPEEIPGEYEDDGDVIRFVPNQSVEVDPVVKLIEEKNIVQFKENVFALIIRDETCTYSVGNRSREDGIIFRYYDEKEIYEINQIGVDKKGTPVFEEPRLIYTHNWGWLPARKLWGKIADEYDGNVLYNSVYVDAVPDLNAVIRLSSNRDMANYKMAFPVIIALVDDCDYSNAQGQSCRNGWLLGEKGLTECPSCKGTGTKSNHSPTGVYEVRATKGYDQTNTLAMSPPVQFAAPDIQILDYLDKQIENKKKSAFSFIFETDDAKSNTATGVALEKEEFHSFLIHFSNELFDLLEFTIEAIGFYRWGDKFVKPSITRPIAFNFRSNSDVTAEIKEANEGKMPTTYVAALMDEANQTRFNNNEVQRKRTEFTKRADRLFYKDDLTIGAMLGQGRVDKLAVVLHDSMEYLLDNAEAQNEDFWSKEYDEQYSIVLTLAQTELSKIQTGSKASSILDAANQGEPV